MTRISVVIPVYNEQDSLASLFQEIAEVAVHGDMNIEVIFVDDGSTDQTWAVLRDLSEQHQGLKCIRFRRNFGKAAALSAGFEAADSQIVITMDGDLQDDPSEIPRLLQALESNDLDVVSGWKKERKDPWNKRFPSKIFNGVVSWLSGVHLHDHNCGLKCYRREVFKEVQLYGERHRFIPVLAASRGFAVGEMIVNHRPRQHGHSKYNWRRLPKGLLDLMTISFLTGFKNRPQHLIGSIGLTSFLFGALGMVLMAIYWILRMVWFPDWTPLHQRPIVLYSLGALLLGAQLLCMGFLAELMIANSLQKTGERPYSVKDELGFPEKSKPDIAESRQVD
ncbi:MAG: glycosyltransferase family 2 protein [Mariniblastus sp.]|nr:glycosyltransferase family 2 protein [Mariniblastus sp.]